MQKKLPKFKKRNEVRIPSLDKKGIEYTAHVTEVIPISIAFLNMFQYRVKVVSDKFQYRPLISEKYLEPKCQDEL